MKKASCIFITIMIIMLSGCSETAEVQKGTVEQTPVQMPDKVIIDSPANVAAVEGQDSGTNEYVEIKGFAFNPSSITIKRGATVTWTQMDPTRHDVVEDSGKFESPLLSKGESWSYTFNEEGTFTYYCRPHPKMKAEIIVE